jgi:hypothetical protein
LCISSCTWKFLPTVNAEPHNAELIEYPLDCLALGFIAPDLLLANGSTRASFVRIATRGMSGAPLARQWDDAFQYAALRANRG